MEDDIELARAKTLKFFKYGGLLVLVALMVPFIFAISMAIFGTIAAAGATIVAGLILVNLLPQLSMKLTNWKLKGLKKEAETNPIETMQNQAQEMAKHIDLFAARLADRKAEGKRFVEEIEEFRKEDPEGAAAYDAEIASYDVEIIEMTSNLNTAVQDLEKFKEVIKKADRRWKIAVSSEAFRKGAPGERDLILQGILKDAALEAVSKKAHMANSRLQVDAIVTKARTDYKASKTKATQVIENNPSPALAGLDISIPELVEVKEVRK